MWYLKSKLPRMTLMQRCCPILHAMVNKYFGEKTVQMNKCVLKAVHASMTESTPLAENPVNSDEYCNQSSDRNGC